MTEGHTIGAPKTMARSAQNSSQMVRALFQAAAAVDQELLRVLPEPHGLHARVQEAMRYAITAGGKRLRPFLVIESAKLFKVDPAYAVRAAAAIELVHTYSLVHDDLPCMDDDDMRRGRPTVHRLRGFGLGEDPPLGRSAVQACRAARRSFGQQRHDRRSNDRHGRAESIAVG
jgi:hypothetical protein